MPDAAGNGEERGGPGRFRRALQRLSADRDAIQAEDLQSAVEDAGATPVARCQDRDQVTVAGTLRTVTLRPRAGVPTLEAELYDGTGSVSLVWLGRHRITGIEPGRHLVAHGRLSMSGGRRLLYNPEYEIRPGG